MTSTTLPTTPRAVADAFAARGETEVARRLLSVYRGEYADMRIERDRATFFITTLCQQAQSAIISNADIALSVFADDLDTYYADRMNAVIVETLPALLDGGYDYTADSAENKLEHLFDIASFLAEGRTDIADAIDHPQEHEGQWYLDPDRELLTFCSDVLPLYRTSGMLFGRRKEPIALYDALEAIDASSSPRARLLADRLLRACWVSVFSEAWKNDLPSSIAKDSNREGIPMSSGLITSLSHEDTVTALEATNPSATAARYAADLMPERMETLDHGAAENAESLRLFFSALIEHHGLMGADPDWPMMLGTVRVERIVIETMESMEGKTSLTTADVVAQQVRHLTDLWDLPDEFLVQELVRRLRLEGQ